MIARGTPCAHSDSDPRCCSPRRCSPARATRLPTPAAVEDASPVATAAPTSPSETPEPAPSATATPEQRLDIVYIGTTAGTGVGLRDGCHAYARIDGAWADGTAVRIINPGEGACGGWTYVVGPGVGSWVLDAYLTEVQLAVAPPSTPSTPDDAAPTTPSGPPAGAPMFVFGFADAGDFVTVWAGNELCDSAIVATAGGLWGLSVGPGTECTPAPGAPLVFAVNGTGVATAGTHTYQPGGNEHVSLIP